MLISFARLARSGGTALALVAPLLSTATVSAAEDSQLAELRVPRLPPAFLENAGQYDARARFVCSSGAATAWFADREFVYSLVTPGANGDGPHGGANVRFTFEAASDSTRIEGDGELATRFRFYRGNDPSRWTSARGFGSVRYRDLYPDVDVTFRTIDGRLEYDVVAGPLADTRQVVVRCDGATSLAIDPDGSLVIGTVAGLLRQEPPMTMKLDASGERSPVESRFRLLDASRFAFEVGDGRGGDAGESLIIDPTLAYSTYIEGALDEYGKGVAVDDNGVVTLVGLTMSSNFPTTAGAYDVTQNGNYDAVILKVNAAGNGLLFATFFGGTNDDRAFAVARDDSGNAYVAGTTLSLNFPATGGALATNLKGSADAYAAKFDANGALVYATYLGGTNAEAGHGIGVDDSGRAVVIGETLSVDFPTNAGAFDATYGGTTLGIHGDAFVARISASGGSLVSGTYLGGAQDDVASGISVDGSGDAYVTGSTGGASFPTTAGAFDTTFNNGPADAFVARVDATGGVAFSTFVGGSGNDAPTSVAALPAGGAIFTGSTGSSTNFPTTPSAYDTSYNGSQFDVFVARIDPTGATLVYGTYLGGGVRDFGTAIATDGAGRAYVTGNTNSANFPTSPGAWDTTPNGNNDVYIAKLDAEGATLQYSSLIGGAAEEFDYAIAVDRVGAAYFTGYTAGSYPTTPGAFQTAPLGANDAFLTKFDLCSGSFTSYGTGCSGSGGFVPVLAGSGCAAGGFDVTFSISQALGGSTGLIFFGLGQGTLQVIPTCALQIAPVVTAIIITVPLFGAGPGGGAITLTGPLPPEAIPFDIYIQTLIGDPGGNGGLAATNPVKMHIGP